MAETHVLLLRMTLEVQVQYHGKLQVLIVDL